MLYDLITEKIKCYLDILGLIIGSIMQYIISHKKSKDKLKFMLFLATSSIFSALFIVTPILEYFDLGHTRIAGSAYALSSIISLQLISFVTSALPDALKQKVLDIIGAYNVRE